MPLRVFEAASLLIVLATLVAMARRQPAAPLLRDYGLLVVAGFVGEQSAISLYRFYTYAEGWDGRVIDVPLLVPLIWPLVILSAREVATGLFPTQASVRRAAIVGAIVVIDASLVEVLAVRAGLWSWEEGGHLGVPLIGILGWGFFAFGADLALTRFPRLPLRASVVVLAPLIAQGLIVASWWSVLRWVGRGALGNASLLGVLLIALGVGLLVLRARRAGGAIPLEVAWPRVFAAGLFLALFLSTAPDDAALWLHLVAVAVPYSLATRWRWAHPEKR